CFHGTFRRHPRPDEIEIGLRFVPGEIDFLAVVLQLAVARLGFRRMVVVGETIEALAVNLPDEQAAPRLELADIARGIWITPRIPAGRLDAEFGAFIQGEAVIGGGELAVLIRLYEFVVGIEIQVAGNHAGGIAPAMTGNTTAIENRFDVAPVFDIERAVFQVSQSGGIIDIPFAIGSTRGLISANGSIDCEVPDSVFVGRG